MKKKISLKWKIARYLLIFAALVIGMIWIFQTLLLEPMYERSKIKSVKDTADQIAEAVQAEDQSIADIVYTRSMENDTCVRIFSSDISMIAGNSGCTLYHISSREISENTRNAFENGGSYINMNAAADPRLYDLDFKSVTYTRIVETDNENVVVMVNTGITPLNPTTDTLRSQLYLISVFIVAAVLLLTWVLHVTITRPLSAITNEARYLPEGKFEADEDNSKYLEAQLLNETLAQAATDIRKADQAKKDLIANVSHDLRTPLTMISGYGEMMRDLPGEKNDENLQVIIDESKRLTLIVNDLLDLSRLQAGKITLEKETFDLCELIRIQLKKYEVYEQQEGFEFVCDIPEQCAVYADENRIAQVLNNFLSNAVNYSGDSRKIIIRVKAGAEGVRTEVQDFGEGIPEEKQKDIWDRYYKIDRKHVRPVSGSGIGLSIVREILELHDAPYGVTSEVNSGSMFWFILPKAGTDGSEETKN